MFGQKLSIAQISVHAKWLVASTYICDQLDLTQSFSHVVIFIHLKYIAVIHNYTAEKS